MEVEDRTCSLPRPCLLRRRLLIPGIFSKKKRHRHRLSIQSVFPGLPNTLLIRKKPPILEKRSTVWFPSITFLNLNWSREMNPHHILKPSNRNPQLEMEFENLNKSVESSVTVQGKVQDSSQIYLPSHPQPQVWQGIQSNVRCSISRLLQKLD